MIDITNTTTPCVGLCSTVYGDDVCRGCKRYSEEVIDWNGYDDPRKLAILQRLDKITCDMMAPYFKVDDEQQVDQAMEQLQLRLRIGQPPLSKAFRLLQYLSDDPIPECTSLGITCLDMNGHESLQTLIHALDDALYEVAESSFMAMQS